MNNIFNVRRFCLLLKKTLLERPVQIMGFTGLMLTISFILYAISHGPGGSRDFAQNSTFFIGLAGGGSFLASVVFGYFGGNAKGYSYLTLPASPFEKWLCGVLIVGVLYPAVFILFFSIMDRAFASSYLVRHDPAAADYPMMQQVFPLDGWMAQNVYTLFFIYAGAMMVGSLYFNKMSFIKTALILFGLFIFFFVSNSGIAKVLFGDIGSAMPFEFVFVRVGYNDFERITLPENVAHAVNFGVRLAFPASLWLISLVRLREKEF